VNAEFTCPRCGSHDGQRDEVDIGVGIQYGPWGCAACGWTEADTCPICGGTDVCKDGCMPSMCDVL